MAISFVQNIGTASGNAASVAVTAPAGGVAAGDAILVAVFSTTTGTITITDSAANSYSQDADSGSFKNERVLLFSCPGALALTSGQSITISCTASGVLLASACEVSGLAATGALDQIHTGTGFGGTLSSGSAPTTTDANEFLFGATGFSVSGSHTYTGESGWTQEGAASYTGANVSYLEPEYRIVSATAAYAATASSNVAVNWAAAVATYKEAISGVLQAAGSASAVSGAAATALLSAAATANAPALGSVSGAPLLAAGAVASTSTQATAAALAQLSAAARGAGNARSVTLANAGRAVSARAIASAAGLIAAGAALIAAAQSLAAALAGVLGSAVKLSQPPNALRGTPTAGAAYLAVAGAIVSYQAAPACGPVYRAAAELHPTQTAVVSAEAAYQAKPASMGAGLLA
jgi:hypothetical protein